MPTINQNTEIKITPERFLTACSPAELFEVNILIQQNRFQRKISDLEDIPSRADIVPPAELEGQVYRCIVCKEAPVDAINGYDTCDRCILNQ